LVRRLIEDREQPNQMSLKYTFQDQDDTTPNQNNLKKVKNDNQVGHYLKT